MYHPFPDDRKSAIERAKRFVDQAPLFLDTETTGLTDRDEICEIAIVDLTGAVLINSLVRPVKKREWAVAAEIHGITREVVLDQPTFRDLLPELEKILRNRTVLLYNADFDKNMLWSTAGANGISDFAPWWLPAQGEIDDNPPASVDRWHCAMELYAMFHGAWSEYHHTYNWVRLSTAAKQCGIQLPAGIHRAHADAELTRQIVAYVAVQPVRVQLDFLESEDA